MVTYEIQALQSPSGFHWEWLQATYSEAVDVPEKPVRIYKSLGAAKNYADSHFLIEEIDFPYYRILSSDGRIFMMFRLSDRPQWIQIGV